jgi:hypothetical protein
MQHQQEQQLRRDSIRLQLQSLPSPSVMQRYISPPLLLNNKCSLALTAAAFMILASSRCSKVQILSAVLCDAAQQLRSSSLRLGYTSLSPC